MGKLQDAFGVLTTLPGSKDRFLYSLPKLEKKGLGEISRLPVTVRIMLESLLRNLDGTRVTKEDIESLAKWGKGGDRDVPFIVSRVVLQDFTGVPLLVDLAAMRDAAAAQGYEASIIEPTVPVDLVVDHSVQVDRARTEDAFETNLKIEFERNGERYAFLKWGQEAFKTFRVVPPGIGIVHQVNLELLASVVIEQRCDEGTILSPDTLVGTDSHTTMISGLGVLGWGVGGIEAEAAMLAQPIYLTPPEVIGVNMTGSLASGVTATDLALRVTEMLREENVVGKFVEFHGEGARELSVADRATISNMSPEYGATTGLFPCDEKSLEYMRLTGRSEEDIDKVKSYLEAQGLFGIPMAGDCQYSKVLELDLSTLTPSVSGPKRPQDRIEVNQLKQQFNKLLTMDVAQGGYSKSKKAQPVCVHQEGHFALDQDHQTGGIAELNEINGDPKAQDEAEMVTNRPHTKAEVSPGYAEGAACDVVLRDGSVVIAAITSCTNTSNPSVMVGAGLLAKKAVEKGLKVNQTIKTSLAPGSRVVTDYLDKADLQKYLDELGFRLVAYGCTTCIGNSGPLEEGLEQAIKEHDVISASVLSGNRNFEARIHGTIKANFLMSPPLVVAYAIAGTVDINLEQEPLGYGKDGEPVFLRDIWPSKEEIDQTIANSLTPDMFKERYSRYESDNPLWQKIPSKGSDLYEWDDASTYIQLPPYFEGFTVEPPPLQAPGKMRALALFGDSVTTDHISPAGAFAPTSPAGQFLQERGVEPRDFNSYGSRRGNDRVMVRGTFANVRIRNPLADGKEGGYTKKMPEGEVMTIYDACQRYREEGTPLIVFAGKDYGMGSSRDWAAKGTALLGVKAVVAVSFERIHRSNLIGMGVLPLEFPADMNHQTLGFDGSEEFVLEGLDSNIQPGQKLNLQVFRNDKLYKEVPVTARLDTPVEVQYYLHGGILPYVLRQIIREKAKS